MTDTGKILQGQVALVTGGNSGIGAAIVRAMAAAGAGVVINYVAHPEVADAMVAEIGEGGGRAIAVKADVGDEKEVVAMFQQARDRLGTVDIAVCNAGIQKDASFLDMSLDDWNAVLHVNLTGAFLCAREAAREFVRRGLRPEVSRALGKILFTSSVHEVIPWAGHVNYATTKGGIHQLMQSVAQELAPHRIRANSIAPGAIKTPINRKAWDTPAAEIALEKLIPYGRVGDPKDIGNVAAWLASDAADYVCGATIFVDGGMTLYPGFSTGGG